MQLLSPKLAEIDPRGFIVPKVDPPNPSSIPPLSHRLKTIETIRCWMASTC